MPIENYSPHEIELLTCFGPTTITVLANGYLRVRWEMLYPGPTKRLYSVRLDITDREGWVTNPAREQVVSRESLRIKYSEQDDHEFHMPKSLGYGYRAKTDPWKDTVRQINAELRPQVLAWKEANLDTYYGELAGYVQVEVDKQWAWLTKAEEKLNGLQMKLAEYKQKADAAAREGVR